MQEIGGGEGTGARISNALNVLYSLLRRGVCRYEVSDMQMRNWSTLKAEYSKQPFSVVDSEPGRIHSLEAVVFLG